AVTAATSPIAPAPRRTRREVVLEDTGKGHLLLVRSFQKTVTHYRRGAAPSRKGGTNLQAWRHRRIRPRRTPAGPLSQRASRASSTPPPDQCSRPPSRPGAWLTPWHGRTPPRDTRRAVGAGPCSTVHARSSPTVWVSGRTRSRCMPVGTRRPVRRSRASPRGADAAPERP